MLPSCSPASRGPELLFASDGFRGGYPDDDDIFLLERFPPVPLPFLRTCTWASLGMIPTFSGLALTSICCMTWGLVSATGAPGMSGARPLSVLADPEAG